MTDENRKATTNTTGASAHGRSRPSFREIGLPDGHAFPQLAYHEPTRTIIAHTQPVRERLSGNRLSFRKVTESKYFAVADFPNDISVHSFAICPTLPVLYYITLKTRVIDGRVGGEWDALYRFDLTTRVHQLVTRCGSLSLPDHYESGWLSELLSVGEDGATIFCQAGLERRDEGGSRVDYYISQFSVADFHLAPITRLEATFA